jgi:DNA gyrase subunit A
MPIARPDLSHVDPAILAYIESLENELHRSAVEPRFRETTPVEVSEPSEPPTTLMVLTATAGGFIKRTPRHFYDRQRRAGMGIFDLDSSEADPPTLLTIADLSQGVVFLTSQARAFRMPVAELSESPVRARGTSLASHLQLRPDERFTLAFPDSGSTYLLLVSQRGTIRRIRYNYLGENVRPGSLMYELREGGAPAAACWSDGEGEVLITTRKGNGIRFAEKQIPVRGCSGIRIDPDDAVVGVSPISADCSVFMASADGKGTVRLMSGFTPNKEPGGGGKVAFKGDALVGSAAVRDNDDVLILSRLGKIIRFRAGEVPAKEGPVQGVNCMALRGDECVALAVARMG